MLKRWKCPRCDAGKLAPSKPRRDDTRRYCLPCSEQTGRLVERICPALETARKKRASKPKRKPAKPTTPATPARHVPSALPSHWLRRQEAARVAADAAKAAIDGDDNNSWDDETR